MNAQAEKTRRLLVVLDPDFGDRLRRVRPDQPIWIVESECNTPVVKALWAIPVGERRLTDITSFTPKARAPEQEFLKQFDTIDLHHGAYASRTPYTTLTVVGARPTEAIRSALRRELGFEQFKATRRGFVAHRSEAEAERLRRDTVV